MGFDLGDYKQVSDRIDRHRDAERTYPDGSFDSQISFHQIGGSDYVMCKASFYRTPDDLRPGVGHSWLKIPGSTSFTRGSEVENAETSARGRALVGALVSDSRASADEIAAKTSQEPADEIAAETSQEPAEVSQPTRRRKTLPKPEQAPQKPAVPCSVHGDKGDKCDWLRQAVLILIQETKPEEATRARWREAYGPAAQLVCWQLEAVRDEIREPT